jgi:hypothetical protein
MYKALITSLLLAIGSSAYGTGVPFKQGGDASASAGASSYSSSSSSSASLAGAVSGSSSGVLSSVTNTHSLTNSPQSTTIISNEQGDTSFKDYTPNALAPTVHPTAPCYVGAGIGIGVPGFSGSLGGAYYDEECRKWETVRIAQSDNSHIVRALASQVLYEQLMSYLEEDEPKKEEAVSAPPTYWYLD